MMMPKMRVFNLNSTIHAVAHFFTELNAEVINMFDKIKKLELFCGGNCGIEV